MCGTMVFVSVLNVNIIKNIMQYNFDQHTNDYLSDMK